MSKLSVVGKAHQRPGAPDAFHWFIYGSSLDQEAFAAWAGQHGYRLPDFGGAVPARLLGFRLAFDVTSRFWGGAVASLAEDPAGAVEGIALPLPGEARPLADHKEGAISGLYVSFEVEVEPLAGGAPLRALAYRANPERRLAREEKPAPQFLDVLLRGAKAWKLSPEWISKLDALGLG